MTHTGMLSTLVVLCLRRQFVNPCFGSQSNGDSKYNTNGAPRGKDVLGKSNN